MKPQYCAIIGDINRSRTLPRRGQLQKKFSDAVTIINREYRDQVASRFLVTLGDEFQGLLKTPERSYELVRRFQDIVGNVTFSYGVGIGTLTTPLDPKLAIGMDGECFHRARAAVSKAKKNKRQIVYDFNDPGLDLVNAMVAMLDKQWKFLGATQRKIAQLMKDQYRQVDIAKKLRISQQAVSKARRSSALAEMQESVDALQKFLGSLAP